MKEQSRSSEWGKKRKKHQNKKQIEDQSSASKPSYSERFTKNKINNEIRMLIQKQN